MLQLNKKSQKIQFTTLFVASTITLTSQLFSISKIFLRILTNSQKLLSNISNCEKLDQNQFLIKFQIKSKSRVQDLIFLRVDNLGQKIDDKSLLALEIDFQKVIILIFFFNKNFSENLRILNLILGKTNAEQKKIIFLSFNIYFI